MKIKAVCEKTGLTDRTIRYYIEEGLISPAFTENYLGRKSFDFSDGDISELCDIAVLRNFDFSIEEIRQLLSSPEKSLVIIREVKERISAELLKNQKKLFALSSLNEDTVYTVSELAKELSRPERISPAEEKIETKLQVRIISLLKGGIFFLAVWLPILISVCVISTASVRYENPIVAPIFLVMTLLLLLPSLLSVFASKIKSFRHRIAKKVLFIVCLLCIPISVFSSFSAVYECEHSWGEIATQAEVSCAREGRVVKRCDICREVEIVTLEKLAHTVVKDEAVEATCFEEGLGEGEHCGVCQTVLVKQEVIPKKEHTYVKNCVEPTCDTQGYTLFSCHCGYGYKDNVTAATEKHDFKKNGELGYICSFCSLEVCEYGFVDGDGYSGAHRMRYYITGSADKAQEQQRTLVIYGNGDMPEPLYQSYHPWRDSIYVEEIKTVIICEGVTSIAKGAFTGSVSDDSFFGNPFRSVESFIVRSATLTIDSESPDVSGIECDITYTNQRPA